MREIERERERERRNQLTATRTAITDRRFMVEDVSALGLELDLG
jgi:hypothetical protein